MKLSKKALNKIDAADVRLKLALGLEFSETWVRTLIKSNKSNGPLTTERALQIIEKETGLSREQILVSEALTKEAVS